MIVIPTLQNQLRYSEKAIRSRGLINEASLNWSHLILCGQWYSKSRCSGLAKDVVQGAVHEPCMYWGLCEILLSIAKRGPAPRLCVTKRNTVFDCQNYLKMGPCRWIIFYKENLTYKWKCYEVQGFISRFLFHLLMRVPWHGWLTKGNLQWSVAAILFDNFKHCLTLISFPAYEHGVGLGYHGMTMQTHSLWKK